MRASAPGASANPKGPGASHASSSDRRARAHRPSQPSRATGPKVSHAARVTASRPPAKRPRRGESLRSTHAMCPAQGQSASSRASTRPSPRARSTAGGTSGPDRAMWGAQGTDSPSHGPPGSRASIAVRPFTSRPSLGRHSSPPAARARGSQPARPPPGVHVPFPPMSGPLPADQFSVNIYTGPPSRPRPRHRRALPPPRAPAASSAAAAACASGGGPAALAEAKRSDLSPPGASSQASPR